MRRPVIVIKSDHVPIPDLTIVVPTTAQGRRRNPMLTVDIPAGEGGLERDSLALCHNIRVVDTANLVHGIGNLGSHYISRIELRLTELLGLPI